MTGNIIKALVVITVVASLTTLAGCNKEEKTEVEPTAKVTLSGDATSQYSTESNETENPEPQGIAANLYKDVATNTDENFIGTIDGEKITQSEYRIFLTNTKYQMESIAEQKGVTDLNKYWETQIDGKDPKDIARDQAMSILKGYKTQLIQVKNDKYKVSEDKLKEIDRNWAEMVFKKGEEAGLTQIINQRYGVTLDHYKTFVYNYSTIDNYIREKQEKLEIQNEEVNTYFEENKDKYSSVTVVHVLFSTVEEGTEQQLSEEKVAEANKKAEDTLAKIKSGEDPKALAKELSEDPGVAENQGEYTFKKTANMVKEFKDWAFNNKVGDSGIVKTQFGFHVMKKTNSEEGKIEELKPELINELKQTAMTDMLKAFDEDPKYEIKKNDAVYNSLEK